MVREAEIFSKNLTEKHIPHSVEEDTGDKSVLKININMGAFAYDVFVIAESDCTMTVRIRNLLTLTDDQLEAALTACNELTRSNRWAKVFVAEDNQVVIEDNERTDTSFDGEKIFGFVGRNMGIAAQVHEKLM